MIILLTSKLNLLIKLGGYDLLIVVIIFIKFHEKNLPFISRNGQVRTLLVGAATIEDLIYLYLYYL